MARITLAELIDLLRVRVADTGGQQQFADAAGVSQGYINDILSGKREPGPKILMSKPVDPGELIATVASLTGHIHF